MSRDRFDLGSSFRYGRRGDDADGSALTGTETHGAGTLVTVRRVRDDVAGILRQWILDGTLAPGSRLRVADLAGRLSISPMPVREAIRQLEASGLVATEPHRGARVARLDPRELEELYEIRMILEPEAARRSVERPNKERAAVLRSRHADLRSAAASGDLPRVLDCDESLLEAVFEGSGNRELVKEIKRLWDRVRPYKLLHMSAGDSASGYARIERWAADLVDACIAGSAELAAERVRRPLEEAQAELVAFMRGA